MPADTVVERLLFQELAEGVTTIRNLDYLNPGSNLGEMLLGGPRPNSLPQARGPRLRGLHALRALYELGVVLANGPRFHVTCEHVAEAEALSLAAANDGGGWTAARALDSALSAGREAWCLHMRTTCVAVAAAALFRRVLETAFDSATVRDLLAASLRRGVDRAAPSGRVGRLPDGEDRLTNY